MRRGGEAREREEIMKRKKESITQKYRRAGKRWRVFNDLRSGSIRVRRQTSACRNINGVKYDINAMCGDGVVHEKSISVIAIQARPLKSRSTRSINGVASFLEAWKHV